MHGGIPRLIAEAWRAELYRLELLAEQEDFWGCHLLLLFHQARDLKRQAGAVAEHLYYGLESPIWEVIKAVRKAALALTRPAAMPPGTSHSDDFRTVEWFGDTYTFTEPQARCVRLLWKAWRAGAGVAKTDLIKASESAGTDVKDIFKNHPAWKKTIVAIKRGYYGLQRPGPK